MKVFAEKQMTNVSINTKLEGKVATIQPGPEKSELVKLVNDRASQIKSKVGKRESCLLDSLASSLRNLAMNQGQNSPDPTHPRTNLLGTLIDYVT